MKDPIAQIKAWLFPGLITVLASIIWNDVQEIKADVKVLMAQSNIDKTRIDNLERLTFKNRTSSNFPFKNNRERQTTILAAVMPNNKDLETSIELKKRKS